MNDSKPRMEESPYDGTDAPFGVHAFIPKVIFFFLVVLIVGRHFFVPSASSPALLFLAVATASIWRLKSTEVPNRVLPVVSIFAFSGTCMMSELAGPISGGRPAPLLGISFLGVTVCLGELIRKRWPHGIVWLFLAGTFASLLGPASSDAGQASPMVAWFVDTFGFSQANAETATIVVRKSIHFTYFGLIAGLAWGGAIRLTGDIHRSAMFALLWTASFAAFDELNQLRFASRSGSGWDFLIDMTGAAAFVGIAMVRRKSPEQVEGAGREPINQ